MTKEELAAQIKQLQREHQNHLEQAFMCQGAIQFAQHLLTVLEQPEPQQQAPAPEPPGNLVEFPKRETSPPIGEPS